MRKTRPAKERFMKKVTPDPNSGCWLWGASRTSDGYGSFNYLGKTTGSHRVSYQMFCGEIPKGLFVLHRCDVPTCVNPEHLFLGTNQDNSDDMVRKKRSTWGDRNSNVKLSSFEVLEIRKTTDKPLKETAQLYKISMAQVSRIISGRRWRHLP